MTYKEEPRRNDPDPSLKTCVLEASTSDMTGDDQHHVTAKKKGLENKKGLERAEGEQYLGCTRAKTHVNFTDFTSIRVVIIQLEYHLHSIIVSWLKEAIKITEHISKWPEKEESLFSSFLWRLGQVAFFYLTVSLSLCACKTIYFSL